MRYARLRRLKNTEKAKGEHMNAIESMKEQLAQAQAVVIGAGSGLSAAAGFTYTGERFTRHFSEFIDRYHMTDMYSAGFYPFQT